VTSLSQMQDIDQIHVVQADAEAAPSSAGAYGASALSVSNSTPVRPRSAADADPERKYSKRHNASWLSRIFPALQPTAMLPVTRRCVAHAGMLQQHRCNGLHPCRPWRSIRVSRSTCY
jgi:hypothetical protein